MKVQLTDKELKGLVETHVSQMLNIDTSKLKVTFTKRSNQTDTDVEILSEPLVSIINAPQVVPDNTETEAVAQSDESNTEDAEKPAYLK